MDIFKNEYSLEEWERCKREETLNLILREEYGFRSPKANVPLTYRVIKDKVINGVRARLVLMTFMDLDMRFYLYTPDDDKKHKCFITILHEYAEEKADPDLLNNFDKIPIVPVPEIIARGFAVAVMPTRDIAPDGSDFKIRRKRDIFATINEVRYEHEWGTLQAWSWGCSKVLDYISTLSEIQADRIGVIGHSRGGKTALLAGIQDKRFYLTVSSCSGNSGAAIARNNDGESIRVITTAMSIWFATNYFKYADHEDDLPFDQHQVIGLLAPRYAYVFSADQDKWACPKNELLSCRLASQYYNLYGKKGLVAPEEIQKDVSYNEGEIAYHIKTGVHSLEKRDWVMVMDYFDKIG